MAFCPECGQKIEGTPKFCMNCGAAVTQKKTAKAEVKVKSFDKVKFKWTFRDYQQAVLDNSKKHLKDKRIHIVAAPGSGKTILGLELVRRLGKPALVMSPSVTIRQQWGERFTESYLPDSENGEDYISYDLTRPKLITSITYQALHAAFTKTKLKAEDDEDSLANEEGCDFSSFELMEEIKKAGISTLCLDEAHHLKSEWQRALEKFVELLGDSVNIISLTATPPYDSTPGEWNRYISLCGDIDEEIFVPQLVLQKTLCPHQDYVYFSYPTSQELKLLDEYKKKAVLCTDAIINSGLPYQALKLSGAMQNDELLYDNMAGFAALTLCAQMGKATLPDGFCDRVYEGKKPIYSLKTAEQAFEFIISNPEIFDSISEELKNILSQNGLIEKKKVCLESTDKLNKLLISSQGKLNSICEIAKAEYNNLGDGLRMLILTDYIKKDIMSSVGTDADIHTMGTVPVFEAIRRSCPEAARTAVLTGTLVILPASALEAAEKEAKAQGVDCKTKDIPHTDHYEVIFAGSNKNKVSIITKIFGDGYINILIGTKSLLGEGWDSPNINSLILASFVGSFMLSNQMRGRAIRIDKTKPDKISNIWHLVTLDPSADNTAEPGGGDYETLKRRFDCFQAPAYSGDTIESGTDRLDIIKPPYDKAGIENINKGMLALAKDRDTVAKRWQGSIRGKAHPEVKEVCQVPPELRPAKAVFRNKLHAIILAIAVALAVLLVIIGDFIGKPVGLVVGIICGIFLIKKLYFLSKNSSPEKSISTLARAVLNTLCELGEIESRGVRLSVKKRDGYIECSLEGGTQREKSVFSKAVTEMLSPIDDPRYILIAKGSFAPDYTRSYACPSVIGNKKENAEVLRSKLRGSGKFELVYTRNEEGRKTLFCCRRRSYINLNAKAVKNKKTVG
ncbi:MAG: DEAD/DEAH box helicase family protein [Clostridia bacterium]|nr:DEAD/DEAH box helicase family protein [Clostridia bacterium]